MNENENEEQRDTVKEFTTIGVMKPKRLITMLYFTGILPISYYSIVLGKYVALTNTYFKTVRTSQGMYTSVQADHVVFGTFTGILCFIIFFIVWKVLCELVLLIFNALNAYVRQKNSDG